jgi:hypothetical protein
MPFDKPSSPRAGLAIPSGGRKRWRSAMLSAALQTASLVVAGAILIGCAAPGEPTARHPVVPQAVKDLSARQQGDGTVLTFTLPSESTGKKPLGGPLAVEIYRSAPAPSGAAVNKTSMRLVDTIPAGLVASYEKDGRIEFRDEIDPAQLARQPGQQVTYAVRTRVSGEHSSADSNPAKLPVYPAPPPASDLHASLAQKSIDLTWAPPESDTIEAAPGPTPGYRVYRAEIDPGSAAAAAEDPSKAVLRGALSSVALVRTPAYQDMDFSVGHSYLYLVRAVAQFGPDAVESLDSNGAIITAMDVFPPAPPQGLVAVIVPATLGVPTYVELSWSISPEADLAGYEVYRSEQPDTQGERMNSELLSAPTFRDMNVTAGQQHFYRVRAVDHAGNESPFSAGAEVDLAGR